MTADDLHAMSKCYEEFSEDILARLQENSAAWENFCHFPLLYQRICIANIEWARKDKKTFEAHTGKHKQAGHPIRTMGRLRTIGRF